MSTIESARETSDGLFLPQEASLRATHGRGTITILLVKRVAALVESINLSTINILVMCMDWGLIAYLLLAFALVVAILLYAICRCVNRLSPTSTPTQPHTLNRTCTRMTRRVGLEVLFHTLHLIISFNAFKDRIEKRLCHDLIP